MMNQEIKCRLERSLSDFEKSITEAKKWLQFVTDAHNYYQEWLSNPELQPPSREFPTLDSEEPR